MIRLKKIDNNFIFIILLFLLIFIFFINSPLVYAEESFDYGGLTSPFNLSSDKNLSPNEVELDFSKVDNPWNLSEKIIFTIPDKALQRKYTHISVNKNAKELIVYSYDNILSVENNRFTSSIYQNIYMMIFHYDNSTNSFTYHHDWTWSSVNSIEYFPIIYSNYDFLVPTKFPDWTSQFKKVKNFFDNDINSLNMMKLLINKLNKRNYKYIITSNLKGNFYIIISKNNKEFNLDNNALRYTDDVYILNNGNRLTSGDLFQLSELTEEKINIWLDSFDKEKETLSFGTLGSPFWGYPDLGHDTNIIIYSSFKDKFTFTNIDKQIKIGDSEFSNTFPTFNNYYNNYFGIEDNVIDDNENPFDHMLKPGVDFNPDGPVLDEDFSSNSKNAFTKLIDNLLHMLDVYFPILKQVDKIIDAWKFKPTKSCFMTEIGPYGYIHYKKCKLIPNIEFSLWDYKYNLEGLDVTWFLGYRKYVEFFVKLIVGMTTFLKMFKIVQGMFKN